MKKLLIFITLASTAISTYAQTETKLDSLHDVINSEVNKTKIGINEQLTSIKGVLKANKEQQQEALKSLEDSTKSMIGDSIVAVRTQLSNLMEKEVSALSSLLKAQNKEMAKLNGSIVSLKDKLDGNLTKMNSQLDSLDSGLGDANKQLETTQQSSELARQDIKDNVLYLLDGIDGVGTLDGTGDIQTTMVTGILFITTDGMRLIGEFMAGASTRRIEIKM